MKKLIFSRSQRQSNWCELPSAENSLLRDAVGDVIDHVSRSSSFETGVEPHDDTDVGSQLSSNYMSIVISLNFLKSQLSVE